MALIGHDRRQAKQAQADRGRPTSPRMSLLQKIKARQARGG
jgi:hypothetical protein